MMWMWGSVRGIYIVLYSCWTKQVRIKASQVSSYNAQDQNVTQFLALIARRPFVIYQKKKKSNQLGYGYIAIEACVCVCVGVTFTVEKVFGEMSFCEKVGFVWLFSFRDLWLRFEHLRVKTRSRNINLFWCGCPSNFIQLKETVFFENGTFRKRELFCSLSFGGYSEVWVRLIDGNTIELRFYFPTLLYGSQIGAIDAIFGCYFECQILGWGA